MIFKRKKTTSTPVNKKSQSETSLEHFLNLVIKICVHLAVFFIPLYFLPATASPLEFNKLSLLAIFTGIAGVSWMGRLVSQNKLQLKKSFLSIPILAFSAVYLLSSIFSIYRENSLWGYFGGESMSLAALLFFILLFYIISNNFNSRKAVYLLITNLLFSSFLVFVISLLQLIGINVFEFLDITGKGFNTVGSIYSLSVYAGAILVFSLAVITEKVEGFGLRLIAAFSALSALAVITLINFKLVWLVLIIIMAVLMVVGILRNTRQKSNLFLIPTFIFVFCFFGFITKKPLIPISDLPTEVYPSLNATFKITTESLKERFIFGVGPGNFSYLYAKYKEPVEELINVNFNQGASYVSTLFTTGGLTTILGFLFLIIVMGRYASVNTYKTFFQKDDAQAAQKTDQGERMITPLSLLWLFITIMLFLTASSLALLFVWWIAFALLDSLSSKGEFIKINKERSRISLLAERIGMKGRAVPKEKIPKISLLISLMFVGIVTAFIAIVYIMSQKYLASYHFQAAVAKTTQENPDAEKIGSQLQQAIYYNQNRDSYFSALSDTFFYLANQKINEKGDQLNDEDRTYIWGAVSQGIQAANSAIAINRTNFNNYLKLAAIYQSILGLVEGADQPALENYEEAILLNPTDPFAYNQIARLYLARYDSEIIKATQESNNKLGIIPPAAQDNLDEAEMAIKKALKFYPAYLPSRLIYSSIMELKRDLPGAIEFSQETLRLNQGDPTAALTLALLYYKNQDYDQAFDILLPLTNQWSDYSDAHYVLGLCYAQKKDLAKAKEQFEKVQALNPDNQEIKEILNQLNAGSTQFLTATDNKKVTEVQQKIEEEQKQEEETQNSILENEEGQTQTPSPPEENPAAPENPAPSPEPAPAPSPSP